MGVLIRDDGSALNVSFGNVVDGPAISAHDASARPMARQSRWIAPVALALTDVAAFAISFGIAVLLSKVLHGLFTADSPSELAQQLPVALLDQLCILCGVMLYCMASGHYRDRVPFWSAFEQVVRASTCSLLVAGLVGFFTRSGDMHSLLILPWLAFPAIDMASRAVAKRALHRANLWQIPVLLLGHPEGCDEVMRVFGAEGLPGFRPVGRISPDAYMHLPAEQAGRHLLRRYGAARMVLGLDINSSSERDLVRSVTRHRVPFALVPQTADLPILGCSRTSFFSHDTVVLAYHSSLDQPLHRATKIAADLAVAAVLLLLLAPLFLVLVALVRLDGGPAMFGHERVGRNGASFRCLKFRSMVPNAAEVLSELLLKSPEAAAEWAATRKLASDPRITRIGRFLRKTSLDELPQLLNVLRLEMSLVGPRPIVESEKAYYGEDLFYYEAARPGITGLWQVSGRSDTSYPRRVQLDSWYVRNWTMWHDVAILMKTIPAVLLQKGAR